MCAIINVATPNHSVCTCTVIGNGYILWSYCSTSLKMIQNDFLSLTSPFINDPLKVEEVFALFPTPPLKEKLKKSYSRVGNLEI